MSNQPTLEDYKAKVERFLNTHSHWGSFPLTDGVFEIITPYLTQELDSARLDELNKLGFETAKNDWHKGKASKMWMYVAERMAQLSEAQQNGNEECELGCKGAGKHYPAPNPQKQSRLTKEEGEKS